MSELTELKKELSKDRCQNWLSRRRNWARTDVRTDLVEEGTEQGQMPELQRHMLELLSGRRRSSFWTSSTSRAKTSREFACHGFIDGWCFRGCSHVVWNIAEDFSRDFSVNSSYRGCDDHGPHKDTMLELASFCRRFCPCLSCRRGYVFCTGSVLLG